MNDAKVRISEAFERQMELIRTRAINDRLANEFEDVTIPSVTDPVAHLHPITRMLAEVEDSFKRM